MRQWWRIPLAIAGITCVGLVLVSAYYFGQVPKPAAEEAWQIAYNLREGKEPKDVEHHGWIGAEMQPPGMPGMMAAGMAAGKALTPPPSAQPDILKVALNRKLIREVWLTLQVRDVPKVVRQVRQVTGQLNGYIASISQSRLPTGEWRAEITVRIPSDRYHDALSRLQALGRTDELQEQVQDVTEEFVDLEARLRNLKRSEQQLLELLKRTGRVKDLLDVEREMSERRSEIERLEGRLRLLKHQTTFSIIHVTLREFRPRPMPAAAFSVPKIFADAFRTVVTVGRGLLVMLIWALVFSIFWVPALLFGWWLVSRRRRLMAQT